MQDEAAARTDRTRGAAWLGKAFYADDADHAADRDDEM
jgi:hypothetical protein